jgi:Domain of unknown function (DUF5134)
MRMSTPAWILEIFAAVTLLVAEVSAGQLVIARAWIQRNIADADITVSRLLTGIAMAGVLVPGLRTLPNVAWTGAFAVMTAWLAWRLWRESRGHGAAAGRGHYAPPMVHCAAMLYVFAALAAPSVPGTGGMSGMAGWSSSGLPTLHAPALALMFTLLLIAFAVHDLDRRADVDGYFGAAGRPLVPAGSALAAAAAGRASGAGPDAESAPRAGPAARLLLSPAVVKGCQVATGVAMAFILIIMI